MCYTIKEEEEGECPRCKISDRPDHKSVALVSHDGMRAHIIWFGFKCKSCGYRWHPL